MASVIPCQSRWVEHINMKIETPNYIFSTAPDAGNAALNILSKPVKGAPYISMNVQDPTDVAALQSILNQSLPPVAK